MIQRQLLVNITYYYWIHGTLHGMEVRFSKWRCIRQPQSALVLGRWKIFLSKRCRNSVFFYAHAIIFLPRHVVFTLFERKEFIYFSILGLLHAKQVHQKSLNEPSETETGKHIAEICYCWIINFQLPGSIWKRMTLVHLLIIHFFIITK